MSGELNQQIIETYYRRTPASRAHHAQATRSLPGGDTRSSTFFIPYPVYMEHGEGCYLYDYDGNRYIDFLNNYTSLIHGHAHPEIVQAARRATESSPVFGAPCPEQYRLAEMICERTPGIDLLRFVNSGTEATMMAMRAARAITGKSVILKVDGGYHGSHDYAEVSIEADMGSGALPEAHLEGQGIPEGVLDGVLVFRFNDLHSAEAVLQQQHEKIAAIIVEPVPGSGGIVPPQPGFLQGLRQLADRYGVLLIFDEIITFRLSTGGMQLLEGVTPDLTALGKTIGGGFPVGAFGGKREIMQHYDPAHPQVIHHAGTFNGHNVSMAAGAAALRLYQQAEVDHVNRLGARLQAGINAAFESQRIKAQATCVGSILQIHWSNEPIRNPADMQRWKMKAGSLPKMLHLALLNRGIYLANRGMLSISTPMSEGEIDDTVDIFEETLASLRPLVVEAAPHLL